MCCLLLFALLFVFVCLCELLRFGFGCLVVVCCVLLRLGGLVGFVGLLSVLLFGLTVLFDLDV